MRIVGALVVSGLFLAPIACGSDGSSPGGGGGGIATTPFAGKVSGMAWTMMSGETDAFLSMGSTKFFATLYDQPITTPCSGFPPTGSRLQVILNVPMTMGTYTLGLAQDLTATFVDTGMNPVQNNIAIQGKLQVTSITATTITGGANITADANDTANGQFQINICTM
jgi:hypothetical protein